GPRFMSTQGITEDHYVPEVCYGRVERRLTRESIGTRYVLLAVRIMIDPRDPADADAVHALQNAITVDQNHTGAFEIPNWDRASQQTVRKALISLAMTLPDTKDMFGTKETTDPVRRLIGAASAWGGNPERDAPYLNVVPRRNDGETGYRLTLTGEVPGDAFWS